MKQVVQSLNEGQVRVVDVPSPRTLKAHVLIESAASLVSPGTERMLLEFGRAGWVERARRQPDKVRQVIEKVRTEGLAATLDAVRSKLDQPVPLGYCNVGRVVEVGADVQGLKPGDRVLSNGAHAEIVRVPRNLVVPVPEGLSDEHAAFGILGAIALQGIRLAAPTLGETFVVTGLGVVGLLAVQLLRANGCRVIGLDFDARRVALAAQFGATAVKVGAGEDPELVATSLTGGRGVDGVLLCAATDSSEPVAQAARMCRKRGRIVLVGVTGLELSRADFYEKELSFQVSCSYGPGRYDPEYEQRGHDYPFGFVRWTEQRNIEAFLMLAAEGKIDLDSLLTHRFEIDEAAAAYETLASDHAAIGILLRYGSRSPAEKLAASVALSTAREQRSVSVSFIGAGNYASRVLIPAFAAAGARMRTVCTTGGVAGMHAGRRHGFELASTDPQAAAADPESNTLVVATRHDSHAALVLAGLEAGKHVFVEKPLALAAAEVDAIESAYGRAGEAGRVLTVGFNRRFAPLAQRMKTLVDGMRGPKAMLYTINAGFIPPDHWTQRTDTGGGRIVGEACHFIDFLRWLAGSRIVRWQAVAATEGERTTDDCATLSLRFADGSIGTVHYFANGGRAFPKERIEVFAGGGTLQLDNFRSLRGYEWRGFRSARTWKQDKGQDALARAFVSAAGGHAPPPIPVDEIFEVARVSIACAAALRPELEATSASRS